ncbi:uncharacterized protein STAUR_7742 [Stigmatella aurantiaca DW4/3-1]|uniref:Uncharacterized protein n=1 Tax=Stigmatella aurantiaca (strain DW4/3-1) TaxID=378806 RepID=E3FKC8_STIAD|nr:uncharacterized protein STAUR_7742 [Stigmatella aurantiaca DW4/3-1]
MRGGRSFDGKASLQRACQALWPGKRLSSQGVTRWGEALGAQGGDAAHLGGGERRVTSDERSHQGASVEPQVRGLPETTSYWSSPTPNRAHSARARDPAPR